MRIKISSNLDDNDIMKYEPQACLLFSWEPSRPNGDIIHWITFHFFTEGEGDVSFYYIRRSHFYRLSECLSFQHSFHCSYNAASITLRVTSSYYHLHFTPLLSLYKPICLLSPHTKHSEHVYSYFVQRDGITAGKRRT